jgi:ABC-type cobalamin/Fe3+-siderophores transport system ATPase subunit
VSTEKVLMPFRLKEIKLNGTTRHLNTQINIKGNLISILLGPNGTGKTSLLSSIAHQFSDRRHTSISDWDPSASKAFEAFLPNPDKVITQTFSPFSRFPNEKNKAENLLSYLSTSNEKYASIGFTRGTRIHYNLSREAIGRIIKKLYTDPKHAIPLASAIKKIGFEPTLKLGYEVSPLLKGVGYLNQNNNTLSESIDDFFENIFKKETTAPREIKIKREVNLSSRDTVKKEALEAFKVLSNIEREVNISSKRIDYLINIDISNFHIGNSKPLLKAILTLTRIGLLQLDECYVKVLRKWPTFWKSTNNAGFLKITEASSGEQQLISSLFGIVAEAENDSLIIIDEPELSLHPAWQTQYLDLLQNVLSPLTGCHILIATHSALLAQRARELDFEVIVTSQEHNSSIEQASNSNSIEQTLIEDFEVALKDSNYVSRLLLSLVMKVERDPKQKPNADAELQGLKALYSNSTNKDHRTIKLIEDALAIVNLQK